MREYFFIVHTGIKYIYFSKILYGGYKRVLFWKSSVGIALFICLAVFSYIGIATWNSHNDNYDVALSMLPDYTYAQEKKMLSMMGTGEAYELATQVIEKNPYNIIAYITRGSYLGAQLYVQECIADLDRMLELSPYNVGYYKQYEELLLKMKEALLAVEDGNSRSAVLEMIQNRLDSLPNQLAETIERTSWLAYKINDQPVFSYK